MFIMLMKKLGKSDIKPDQKGFTLVEVLIAVLLVSIIVGGIVMGVITITKSYGVMHEREIAKDLAASNMDWIMSQLYANTYTPPESVSKPPIYGGAYEATLLPPVPLEVTEQQITTNISFNSKIIYTLTVYRTNY